MNQEELAFFKENQITIESEIAKGGFGEIYLVNSGKYNVKFAMKKVPVKRFNQSEVDCMKNIDHVNMINLYSYYYVGDYVYMFMEYCPFDLERLIKREEGLNEDQLIKYIHDILIAIEACHEKNIAHNDIKPSNFLVDKYGRIKVCDFGLSHMYEENEKCSSYKGTTLFMAPEVLKKTQYNPIKADIWSLGVTFFYMATQNYPFMASCGSLLLKLIEDGNYPIFMIRNPFLRQLVTKCLNANPDLRPTVSELLLLPYFKNYNPIANSKRNILSLSSSVHSVIIRPKMLDQTIFPKASVIPFRRCPYRSTKH